MDYVCGDNRFEIIERYKNELISATNIESSPDEMAVLDNILFRFWQMGWLKEQEAVKPIPPTDESDLWRCGNCNHQLFKCTHQRYCENCGKEVKWNA